MPGLIGFALSLTGQGDLLILVAVFGATLSYVLMMAAHITLRVRRPDMHRPYRTPGGIVTSGIALVLACVAVVAGFLVDPRVVIGAALIYAVLIAYFAPVQPPPSGGWYAGRRVRRHRQSRGLAQVAT